MKAWVWQVITMIIMLFVVSILNIPLWAFLLIAAPLLTFGLTYFSFVYSFSPTLEPKEIPAKGYQDRIAQLEAYYPKLYYMQFERIDSFYLKIIPDSIVYVYKHKIEPVFLCQYHLGSKETYVFVTYFENDVSLLTSPSVNTALIPAKPGKFIQVLENHPIEVLFNEHLRGTYYLRQYHNVNPLDIPYYAYRHKFMQDLQEGARHIRDIFAWPVKVVYWTISKRGKVHKRPIDEQLQLGIAQFPEKQFTPFSQPPRYLS
jgi:energy-coupling factor transporter transmembrane protein EcfT